MIYFLENHLCFVLLKYNTGHVHPTRLHFRSEINESHHADDDQSTTTAHLLTYRIYRSPYGGVGTYPPHRSASRANNNNNNNNQQNVPEESNALRFAAAGGATLSRLHMMQQTQGPQAQEAIKRQTMSARGLSDKEFTKHCRGFDVQIKVGFFNQHATILARRHLGFCVASIAESYVAFFIMGLGGGL